MAKHILKYLHKMRDYVLVYHYDELLPLRYKDLDFQFDRDSHKSTSKFVFTQGGWVISLRSVKQSYVVNSTMEVKYVISFEEGKEVV